MNEIKHTNSLHAFSKKLAVNQKKMLALLCAFAFIIFYIYSNNVTGSDCILKYAPQAKSNIAAKLIQKACFQLKSESPSIQAQGKCILRGALKVHNDDAARSIYLACVSKGTE